FTYYFVVLYCRVGRVVASAHRLTRGLGFDSRVEQRIAGLFSVFPKFLSSNAESGIVLSNYGNRLTLYYTGLITQMVKSVCTLYKEYTVPLLKSRSPLNFYLFFIKFLPPSFQFPVANPKEQFEVHTQNCSERESNRLTVTLHPVTPPPRQRCSVQYYLVKDFIESFVNCRVSRVVVSVTTEQGVLDLIPVTCKFMLGFFGCFKNISVVARSLALRPVHSNRLTPTWNLNTNVEK
ncbi:hypothetical protein SFRURICE_013248, partial [Spodoptera frugiperda]